MEPRETDPVLDALYEEGDAATDAASEVARFRDLRVALRDFRDATDQEPAGNMAILMAAARARTPAEPTGLWARLRKWFSVIAVHPAMAAAATVVVVGGVAGALYMNGRGQMVEPTAERAAASEDATASAPAIAGSGAASGWGSAAPTMDRFTAGSGSAAATPMTEKQAGTRANDLAEERAPDPRVTRAPAKPAAGASAGPRGGEAHENAADDAEQEANEIAPRLEADRAVAEKPPALTVASDRPTEPAPRAAAAAAETTGPRPDIERPRLAGSPVAAVAQAPTRTTRPPRRPRTPSRWSS